MGILSNDSIILIEPNIGGHHRTYLYHFTKTLLELKCNIKVYSHPGTYKVGNVAYKTIYYKSQIDLPSNFIFKKVIIIINLFITICNIMQIRFKVSKGEKVFFCCMDEYMHQLMPKKLFKILFPIQYSGLLLASHKPLSSTFFDSRNILKSKYCCSIGVLDEFCIDEINNYQRNVVLFPDFSDESLPNMNFYLTKQVLKKAKGRKIISLLGHISKRKGYETLIKSSALLSSKKYFFLIAGNNSLSDKEILFIKNNFDSKENCVYFNEYIPNEADFNSLVCISDIIFAAYLNFPHSSNMLAKTALFKKQIIVSKGYYMEKITEKYSMGLAINENSAKECASAIEEITNDTELKHKSHYKDYLKKNSIANLKESFTSILHSYK